MHGLAEVYRGDADAHRGMGLHGVIEFGNRWALCAGVRWPRNAPSPEQAHSASTAEHARQLPHLRWQRPRRLFHVSHPARRPPADVLTCPSPRGCFRRSEALATLRVSGPGQHHPVDGPRRRPGYRPAPARHALRVGRKSAPSERPLKRIPEAPPETHPQFVGGIPEAEPSPCAGRAPRTAKRDPYHVTGGIWNSVSQVHCGNATAVEPRVNSRQCPERRRPRI